jgi:hypothetical protein
MSLHVYLLCHNEEVLLPHTVEHYRRRVPGVTFTILDNESDDRSVAIAKELGCTVQTFSTGGKIDDVELQRLKNTVWLERSEGWVIVADMDEWLCVTAEDLAREERRGTTILNTYGWNVSGDSRSATLDDADLHALNTGRPHPPESKQICFRRPQITEMNYNPGAHKSDPQGEVRWSRLIYPLKHIAWPGEEFMVRKHQLRYARGKEQQALGHGLHYTDDTEKVSADFARERAGARTFSEAPFLPTPAWRVAIRRLRRALVTRARTAAPSEPTHLHIFLAAMHRTLKPRTYLEIGVFHGGSLRLALCAAIGIDPAPALSSPLRATSHVVVRSADEFFAEPHPLEPYYGRRGVSWRSLLRRPRAITRWLQGAPRRSDGERFVELGFIDGMHHFEFALRDFMNVERHSAPWSVVVFDDMLPQNQVQALRARATPDWTGDVFRLHKVLTAYRPDLVTVLVDTAPTGVLVVFAPNSLDTALHTSYDQIVAENVHDDPQLVPDEVIRRTEALSMEEFFRSGLLDVVRTARQRRESSAWVARELSAVLARSRSTRSQRPR